MVTYLLIIKNKNKGSDSHLVNKLTTLHNHN